MTIVIPYMQQLSESQDTELLLCLRSWCKNAKFDFNVVLIGDAPDWYNGDHIPTAQVRGIKYARAFDIANKMRYIFESEVISDKFIYTYDDVFSIAPIESSYFDLVVAEANMSDKTYLGSGKWNELLEATFKALDLPVKYNYETHLPRLLDKKRLESIFNSYQLTRRALLFNTLYFNEYFEKPDVILTEKNEIKAYVPSKMTRDKLDIVTKDRLFLNNTNVGWNNSLRGWLKQRFHEKCRFEK